MLPVTATTGAVSLLSCSPSTVISSTRPSKSSVLSLSTLATSSRSAGTDITSHVAAEVSIDRHVSLLRCCPADNDISLPATPFRAIKVFICTSGLDMQREQTSLVSQVYCQLREYCRHNYGLDFHAIDLQWSPLSRQLVSDHNTLAQISIATIDECHTESAGPSFVALIGQRYGEFQEPPKFIRVVDFDIIRDAVARHKARDVRMLAPMLSSVYERDFNSVDPPLYRLKDDVECSNGPTAGDLKRLVMAGIRVCLEEGLMTADDSSFYTHSVFESLLRHGIETSINPSCQCFVVHRTILDLKNYADLPLVEQNFAEVCRCDGDPGRFHLDPQAQRRLAAIVSELVGGSVPPDNVISRTVLWRHDDGISDTLHRDYLDDVCQAFCTKMTSLIDQMVQAQGGLVLLEADSPESKLELEVLQHWTCAVEAVENFQGREDLMELIQSYIMSTELKPLVLFGEVGAGKTTVVAKAAVEASNWINNGTLVSVVRFANATCASRDVRHIVSSICAQLCIVLVQCNRNPTVTSAIYQLGDMSADGFYSLEYEELVRNFHCLLASFPEGLNLAVFIDGIDLLYNGDDSTVGTRLDWIPSCLQEHVKLVLSVRRGELMLPLKRDLIPDANNYVEVSALSSLECQSLLASELLLRYNRQLSEKQLRHVIRKCCSENGAQPMLIKLIASIVNRWSSSGDTENELEQRVSVLPLTLDDAADAVFECVEERYGRSLVARVLGLLTASELGLSDVELEDILSLDDVAFDVLPDRGSSLKIKRMPPIVWFGIKHQLVSCGLLTSRDCQHVRVNHWKHELLASRAAQRYLSDQDTCRQFHSLIADYFLGKWAAVGSSSAQSLSDNAGKSDCSSKSNRLLPTQPIIFDCLTRTGRPRYNLRKLSRLPVHLQRAGRQDELNSDVLFNYEWMYHKSMAVSYDSVIDDYRLSSDSDACLVYVALCQCKRYRGPHGENIAAELTGRLLPYISVHPNIRRLIADCDRYGPALSPIVPNFPYQLTPGVPLKHTIQFGSKAAGSGSGDCVTSSRPTEFFMVGGQSYGLEQLILAKDPKRPEVHVIDPCTGSIKADLMTSIGSLHVSPSGRIAIVVDYDRDKSIKVHRLNGFGGEDSTNFEGKSVNGHKFEGRNGFLKPMNSRPQSASSESTSVKTSSRRASASQDKSHTEKGQFVGHLVPSRLIEMSTRNKHRLTQLSVADTRLGLAVESTVDARSWLMIADLVGCSIIHVDQYRGHVTGCRFLRPHDSRVMYVGVGNRMYTYHLEPTVCRVSETVLDDTVRLMAFSKSGRRGFVAGDRIDYVIALTLDVDPDESMPPGSRSLTEGSVKSTTELELGSNLTPKFTEIPAPRVDEKHQIIDIEVSSNEDLLLIRGRHVLNVVHVGWNRILKVIERPADVPFEFRLPQNNGMFTALQFTQAHFTEDSAFVVASIFRDIYIWPIDSDISARLMTSGTPGSPAPLATLRASIGLISDLFVTSSNTSVHRPHPLVSVDKNSMRLDVWDARVAMATATPTASLDRMTSSIRDVVLTDDDSLAFVSANGSDAVAVFDMRSGQMADLMTHEGVVTSFSVTSDGRFMLVSLLSARPGQFNKIWDTQRRCIIMEFGDVGVYSCPVSSNDGFFVLCQTVQSVCEPYHVMQYRVVENAVSVSQLDFDLPFVLDRPFLTSTDRYLIVFHAVDYDQYSAHYIDPTICAVALRAKSAASSTGRSSTPSGTSLQRTSYGARELKGHVPAIKRILAVRPYPTNSYNVVVLYTNESDRAGSCSSRTGLGTGLRTVQSSGSISLEREGTDVNDATVVKETLLPGGYEHNFGFLIYDVCSAVVCQIIEDCFPPYTDFNRLLSTYNHRLYVDQDSNLYDMATGYCVGTKLFGDAQEGIQYQTFCHDDQLLVGASKDGYLHVVRIEDGQTIANLCVHGKVTALTVCHDTRTLLVGCEDGTLLSYVVIDLTTDADCHQSILQSLGTRLPTTSSGRRSSAISASGSSRAWDKVDRVTGSAPPYSRPPSAVLPSGPSDKLALGLARSSSATAADAATGTAQQQQQQHHLGARRASSSQLYRLNSCKSQACVVM